MGMGTNWVSGTHTTSFIYHYIPGKTQQGTLMNEIEELQQQIQKFHEMADKRGEFLLLGELGNRYFAEGNLNEAEQTYRKSLSLAKEIGDQLGQSSTYSNLGNIYSERKD